MYISGCCWNFGRYSCIGRRETSATYSFHWYVLSISPPLSSYHYFVFIESFTVLFRCNADAPETPGVASASSSSAGAGERAAGSVKRVRDRHRESGGGPTPVKKSKLAKHATKQTPVTASSSSS